MDDILQRLTNGKDYISEIPTAISEKGVFLRFEMRQNMDKTITILDKEYTQWVKTLVR